MNKKGLIGWIFIIILIVGAGVGGYLGYRSLTRLKIISVNFVELDYEEAVTLRECDICSKGYYLENGEKICPVVNVEGIDYKDCQPRDVLCVSSGIKTSFNLVVENYKNTINCKIISDKPERGFLMEKGINYLTNPFPAREGINEIDASFGNYLDREYRMRICCSSDERFGDLLNQEIIPYDKLDSRSDIVCGHDTILDQRCG